MKLRFITPSRQLFSVFSAYLIAFAIISAARVTALAQTGADVIELNGNPPQRKVGVLITRVAGGRVMVREGVGEIGYNTSQIKEVQKAAPPEFTQAIALIEAGQGGKAIPFIKGIADRYRGLPVQWAKDSAGMLGNLLISDGKFEEAELAIKEFKSAYAGGDSGIANIAEARLAAARKQFDKAKTIAEPIVAGVLQKKTFSRTEGQIFGQAYFVLGQCAEGENKLPEAMQNYCRTVAIFYQEASVVADAQKRIDELRKKGIATP